jgi:putative transposase
MSYKTIDKRIQQFLKQIFCGVGDNSPYDIDDFAHVLTDAAEHEDFVNNAAKRVDGPTGETVFSRLQDADFKCIKKAFYFMLNSIFPLVKRLFRNRKVALAFDITDEPYYGIVEGLWIHPQKPLPGTTGCFKYLTLSIVDREQRFVLGSLPVRIGADVVGMVCELLEQARNLVSAETLLFDRGFDSYRLIEALQRTGLHYQILWRKDKWTKKILKKMKRGQHKEIVAKKTYSHKKSKHKLTVRFVFIKRYKRYQKTKAYDWVFATNVRYKWNHLYVDKYRMRWGIETLFRVLDRIGIKTATTNEVIRYFLHLFCCLLYNLWKYACAFGCQLSLKNFVAKLRQFFSAETNKPLILDSG